MADPSVTQGGEGHAWVRLPCPHCVGHRTSIPPPSGILLLPAVESDVIRERSVRRALVSGRR